jgi:predicted DNA-binding transcriptional regulator AlpA
MRDECFPPLLTIKQISGLLNISLRQAYRLRDENVLPSPIRLGRCVRWDVRVIERWVAHGCPTAAATPDPVTDPTPEPSSDPQVATPELWDSNPGTMGHPRTPHGHPATDACLVEDESK